jgi:hypothetical protein
MIHLLKTKATKRQVTEMLEMLGSYIKLTVDIERGIIAGGGTLHADCEAMLLNDGSKQKNIWGEDWIPATQEVTFEALINISPGRNNMSMEIQDEEVKKRIKEIVIQILGNT